MSLHTVKIFVSSPGDVGEERLVAKQVVDRLQGQFGGFLRLEPILWEWEPILATADPQSQILFPSQADIMVCILWSRLGTPLPDKFRRDDGTTYASGTEFELEDALRGHRERGVPDLLVYRKTSEPLVSLEDEVLVQQRVAQRRALHYFTNRWCRAGDGSFQAFFHEVKDTADFELKIELHLSKLLQGRLPSPLAGETAPRLTWTSGSPFRGLLPFEAAHRAVFFGRTRAISEAKEALLRQAASGSAFLVIEGASGCGKSSLLRAGLIPTLTTPGVIEGVGHWRSAVFRPGDAAPEGAMEALATALLSGLPGLREVGYDSRDALVGLLKDAPQHLVPAVRAALERGRDTASATQLESRLVLGVDQFEELFTAESMNEAQRQGFVTALAALARSGVVWVIATLRSDFYPFFVAMPEFVKLKGHSGQYDLLPPAPGEVGRMIQHPALAAGLRFEVQADTGQSLAEALQEAACNHPHSLPLLEFTLDELFKRCGDQRLLTFTAYHQLGGLEGALGRKAEEVFQSLPEPVQREVPALFRSLATVDPTQRLSGRRLPKAQLASNAQKQFALDAFVAARLLVVDHDVRHEPLVGLTHEAFLHAWLRLREWIAEEMEVLRNRARITEQAQWWHSENRNPALLLEDTASLQEAETLSLLREKDLDPITREFVGESQRRHKRKGRILLWVILAASLVVVGSAIAGWLRAGIKDVNRPDLGLALALCLVSGPVAVRLWRQCQARSDLLLLSKDARWTGVTLTAAAGLLMFAFWMAAGNRFFSYLVVNWSLFPMLLHTLVFVAKLKASRRATFAALPHANLSEWRSVLRWYRIAERAELVCMFMTAFYSTKGIMGLVLGFTNPAEFLM